MKTCRCRRWVGLMERRCAEPRGKKPEPEPHTQTAMEALAFFTGVAVVFRLVEALLVLPFMRVDEFVYGLSFGSESLTLRRHLYPLAMQGLVYALGIAVACDRAPGLGAWARKKFEALLCTQKRALWCVGGFVAVLGAGWYAYTYVFAEPTRFYASLACLSVILGGLCMVLRCTLLGRAAILFALFMVIFAAKIMFEMRGVDGDMPVRILLRDGSELRALRCTISRESLAVIKEPGGGRRIIPLSGIKEIRDAPDAPETGGRQ